MSIYNFSDNLRTLLKERQITQKQLANEIYVSEVSIYQWLSGTRHPNVESLILVSEFFDVSLESLLSRNN